jgi:hypothetical protein
VKQRKNVVQMLCEVRPVRHRHAVTAINTRFLN